MHLRYLSKLYLPRGRGDFAVGSPFAVIGRRDTASSTCLRRCRTSAYSLARVLNARVFLGRFGLLQFITDTRLAAMRRVVHSCSRDEIRFEGKTRLAQPDSLSSLLVRSNDVDQMTWLLPDRNCRRYVRKPCSQTATGYRAGNCIKLSFCRKIIHEIMYRNVRSICHPATRPPLLRSDTARRRPQMRCSEGRNRHGASTRTRASQNALRLRKTSNSVLIKIWMSSQTLQLLIYQRSIFTRRAICSTDGVAPRRPLTCAHPVIPGLT